MSANGVEVIEVVLVVDSTGFKNLSIFPQALTIWFDLGTA